MAESYGQQLDDLEEDEILEGKQHVEKCTCWLSDITPFSDLGSFCWIVHYSLKKMIAVKR